MLKQRVITALVLLVVLLPALFASTPFPFVLISLVMITAGAWEWSRMNGYQSVVSYGFGVLLLVVCLISWRMGLLHSSLSTFWLLVSSCWVLLGAGLLSFGVTGWSRMSPFLRLLGGGFVLFFTWLSMSQARLIGVNFLLSTLALVWVADIFAYFVGRAWGGRFIKTKLAPSISPGKSWEGVWGGMTGVLVLAMAWSWGDRYWEVSVPSIFSSLLTKGWWLLLLGSIFMVVMSVVGDLVESLVKRSVGVKDSSGLLPGHGGVLDRIDALLPTLPIAMMLYLI